ncbi:hemerythrin domain-containing protein [Polaromonas sp.]|uniref:hemerythrin domain-containing protein n=1 Tax=Polaromonas sp. TaxID=1869339 RepID=UPI001857C3A1|nr:hemerythrin domain-containing protein [Polaromonas sp.]NMM05632.1 hemerythrin domain-containing protein [Polaromonas sp.]
MTNIKDCMADDHRRCDDIFSDVEQAVAARAWDRASAAFAGFAGAMQQHFEAEEELLFPAFEAESGMTMGPTQVMRDEHIQMHELLAAAQEALAAKDADDYSGNAETLLIMMQQHNMKEENVLYPMCDDHLRAQVNTLLPQLQQKLQ